jgi:FtsX extracellular domain
MAVHAKPTEIAAVRRMINRSDQINRYAFLDKRDAYSDFSRVLRHYPDLVHSIRLADLPTSFRVDFVAGAHADPWAVGIRHFPGVDSAFRSGAPETEPGLSPQEILKLCTAHDFVYDMYMLSVATPREIQAVRSALERQPGVTLIEFLDQEDAIREFHKIYARNQDVLASVNAVDLPTTFRIRIARSVELQVVPLLRSLPGVDAVHGPSTACDAVKGLSPVPR